MKFKVLCVLLFLGGLWPAKASADNRFIVRSRLDLQTLQTVCNPPLLPPICTVVGGLGDPLGQLFLITSPFDLNGLLDLPGNPLGIVRAEVDQLLNLFPIGALNVLPSPLPADLLSDRTPVPYPNSGGTVWNSFANQLAAQKVRVSDAQSQFGVSGSGIVADIDTGVDPNHPALQGVLLQGYDFTRNQAGGYETNDIPSSSCPFTSCPPPPCPNCSPAKVNQSTAAVLDQSTAAVLDGSPYAAFGHGTMVMGIIHLVAPTAKLLPLKAFHSDGTASLSDILRAIYYGVQNGANVINMSFDITTASTELQKALDYTKQSGLICTASAGNDGKMEIVYPAALQTDVMGVASTTDQDARSSFSNFGNAIVWVAAPGEAIVSTYPYNTYAAGWGTSFSAPFVSGGAALLHNLKGAISQSGAETAVANAFPLDPSLGLNHGRLDLMMALGSLGGTPDYNVSASPPSQTINAGQQASFTVSAAPAHGFDQTVTWTCMVAPVGPGCTGSPSSVTLDGSNPATATVALTTTARALAPLPVLPRGAPPPYLWMTLAASFAWLVLFVALCSSSRALRQRPGLTAAAGVLAASLCIYSCGGYPGSNLPGAVTLSSVGVNPTSVTGGSPSTGTVTLSAPAPSYGVTVNLSSSVTTATATVPASVTVAAGATSATFTVGTSAVTTSTSVTITASYAGATKTSSLTVLPAQASPTLSSVTLNPTTVTGGAQSSTGTVTLSGPAPTGGAQVMLSSDNAAAIVPASVTVDAGANGANFTVSAGVVTTSTQVTITASYAGASKTASLTVVPAQTAPTLTSLTLNPMSVTGGAQSSTGTVTLSGTAPTGGAQVQLSSDNAAASVPASMTVAGGASSANFTVGTSAVTSSTPVTISASYAGVTKTASLTLTPPGTPAGTYTLTVTGTSGNLSHATTVKVTVN